MQTSLNDVMSVNTLKPVNTQADKDEIQFSKTSLNGVTNNNVSKSQTTEEHELPPPPPPPPPPHQQQSQQQSHQQVMSQSNMVLSAVKEEEKEDSSYSYDSIWDASSSTDMSQESGKMGKTKRRKNNNVREKNYNNMCCYAFSFFLFFLKIFYFIYGSRVSSLSLSASES
jgi:hypothetical protein